MKCLVPRCKRKAEGHHWPVPKEHDGRYTVPLCKMHHIRAHKHDQEIIQILIDRSPSYWMQTGTWKYCKGSYYRWLLENKKEQEV